MRDLGPWDLPPVRIDDHDIRIVARSGDGPAGERRTLEQFEGSAPGALALHETGDYQPRRLSS